MLKFTLNLKTTSINLDHTLNCGQVFRWKKTGKIWKGIVDDALLTLTQTGDKVYVTTYPEKEEKFIHRYFRFDDDLPLISRCINKDPVIGNALTHLSGLRLIRQDPWECLISFICATFTNIPRIKYMIQTLCQHFGTKIRHNTTTYHSFPSMNSLAKASISRLLNCNLGYRAKYIKKAAQQLNRGKLNLDDLRKTSYTESKSILQEFAGVGPKVADCVLLFSLDKLEAFPVDTWIRRILRTHYQQYFDRPSLETKHVTPRIYTALNRFGRTYFGQYAGYAQEYLYAEYSTSVQC